MSVKDFEKVVEFRNLSTNKHLAIEWGKFDENYDSSYYETNLTIGQILILEEIKDALEEGNEINIKIGYKAQ